MEWWQTTSVMNRPEVGPDDEPTWGDYGQAAKAGIQDVGAAAGAGVRAATEGTKHAPSMAVSAAARWFQDIMGEWSESNIDSMTPVARQRIQSSVTDPAFWDDFISSVGLQGTRMSGSVAAAVLPSLLTGGVVASTLVAGTAAGALSAGYVVDDLYKATDSLSDIELGNQSKFYRGLREGGHSEADARLLLNKEMRGLKPLLMFAIGGTMGMTGPAGQVARAITGRAAGTATSGVVKRIGKAVGAGAGSEFVEETSQALSVQHGEQAGGMREGYDIPAALEQGATAGVLGGVIGGGAGTATRARKATTTVAPPPPATPAPAPGTAPMAPRMPRPAVVPSQTMPVTGVTPAATRSKGKKATVAVVPQGAPSADVAVAIEASKPAPAAETTVPPPVAQASQRLEQPAAQPVTTEVTPPAAATVAPQVPAGVATASTEVAKLTKGEAIKAKAKKAPKVAPVVEPIAAIAPEPSPTVTEPTEAPVEDTGGPRVLQDTSPEAKAATAATTKKVAENIARLKAEEKATDKAPKAGHRTKKEKEARSLANDTATRIVDGFKPAEAEANYALEGGRGYAARGSIMARARAMVVAANEADMKVPSVIAESKDKDMEYNNAMMLLAEAQALTKHRQPTAEQLHRFVTREYLLRGGDVDLVKQERHEEGEQRKASFKGDIEAKADTSKGAASEEQAEAAEIAKEDDAEGDARGEPEGFKEAADEKGDIEASPSKTAKGAVKLDDGTEGEGDKARAKAANTGKVYSEEEKAAFATKMGLKTAPSAPAAEPVVSKGKAVAEAAKQTEKNPTEAQKKAGNYPKGKVSFDGIQMSIETPAGAIRSGVAPDGAKWSVKMPVHYGYIRGTKGADGDQVDAFIGTKLDSPHVFVIDQVDPDTRAFDEHKVMLGFANASVATDAYERSFSDGRAAERVGDFRVMTVDEFKNWLNTRGATKKPAGEVDADVTPEGNEVVAPNLIQDTSTTALPAPIRQTYGLTVSQHLQRLEQLALVMDGVRVSGPFSRFVKYTETEISLVAESMSKYGPNLRAVARATTPVLIKRIGRVAGDTPVFVLPNVVFEAEYGPNFGAVYRSAIHAIVVKESTFFSDTEYGPLTMLHEGVHAAFMKTINDNSDISLAVDAIARELAAARPGLKKEYAFANVDEFVAEAFSEPALQAELALTPASPELQAILRNNNALGITHPIRTLWGAIRALVGRALGFTELGKGQESLLDAMLAVGAELEHRTMLDGPPRKMTMADTHILAARRGVLRDEPDSPWWQADIQTTLTNNKAAANAPRLAEQFFKAPALQEQVATPAALMLRTMDQIAQVANDFFGKANPVRTITDINEMMRVTGDRIFREAEPIIAKLHALERKYQGEVWQEFVGLVHDETMAGAFADRPLDQQTHLGKKALKGMWGKAKHAGLAARYAKLPSDLKAARKEAMGFFTDQQNAMSLGIINNRILKALGVEDEALAQRIHEDTTTDADAALLGPHVLELILEAKELSKVKGPYFPLMRRGDFVVRGRYKIAPPSTALRQIDNNTWEFDNRDTAIAWAEKQDTRPTIRSIWLDGKSGNTWVTDKDGKEVRIRKEDADAVQRFRVSVQDRHVEFFPTKAEALAAAAELEKSSAVAEVKGTEERKFEPGDRQVDMLSSQLQSLIQGLERRDGYRGLTTMQKNELVQTLNQASIRYLGATRIQSRRLQRTYVEGASRDLTQNTLEYAQSSSGYLAKLEHQPAMDEALKALDAAVGDETRAYGKAGSLARSAIANEVKKRIHSANGIAQPSKYAPWVQRLLTASFVDKLLGPSYSIINATQTLMITYPELAARYGPGVAFRELSRAYNDVGSLQVLKGGLQHTYRKAIDPGALPLSLLEDVKSRLGPAEGRMLTHLSERGSIDPDAGLEIHRLIQSRSGGVAGNMDKVLGYLEGIGRQLPIAVETVNRTVSALAAYRLEMARSKDHDTAVLYAQEVTNRTQFVYSNTNAPPIFNHPVARVALQFKKFGQGMYGLIGYNIGKALRNANEGDRAEAVKTLAYLMGTHVAMAGSLGLPTEPFKWLLMGAQAAGLGFGWEDVERYQREAIADFAGQTMGEAITRGLPRLIGIDLSSRVGLDNLMSFGEPREYTESEVQSWLFKTAAGAPPGMVMDWVKGVNQVSQGEFIKAAELMIPVKVVSDSIRAYRTATEGKKSTADNQTMTPYGPGEAVARVLGFTPRREAETFERTSSYYAKQRRQGDQRTELMQDWAKAAPSDRSKMWSDIVRFNRGRPPAARITRAELMSYTKRRLTEARNGTVVEGMRITKRDQHILEGVDDTYNLER